MKKALILCLIACFALQTHVYSQKKTVFLTNIDVTISTSKYQYSKMLLNDFIKKTNAQINQMNETQNGLTADFNFEDKYIKDLDSLIEKLGYVSYKNIISTSSEEQFDKLQTEKKYLIEKKESYDLEIKSMGTKSDKYYTYWEEVQNVNKRLFEIETELKSYDDKKITKAIIRLNDDAYDLTDRQIVWVNMPGVAFEFLSIETPNAGITAGQYMGYSLKYMITRGKTHFTIGNLKEYSAEPQDSMRFTELFHTGFGQDFYTKHFGRGKRTWFNLYSGYNVGAMFATSDKRNSMLPYLKAFLGVEIFKNKYFLVDNKVGYFVPFKYNRNLRGIEYSFSFNFVF